jgi:two-component system LytT family response regulator
MNVPTQILKAMVIENDRPTRDQIETLLGSDPELRVVARCESGPEARAAILQHGPDILFLEAALPGLDAFDTLASLPAAIMPKVVFVTTSKDFALRAFEVRAVDYLLKPFDNQRFAEAVARAKAAVRLDERYNISNRLDEIMRTLRTVRPAPAAAPDEKVREGNGRIFIRSAGEIHLVASDEIQWIQSDGDYVRLHAADNSRLVRMPLGKMMTKLNPAHFVRIHRSAAVNLRHLSRATPARYGEYTVKLANGTKLKVSRTFVRSLKTHL